MYTSEGEQNGKNTVINRRQLCYTSLIPVVIIQFRICVKQQAGI